MDAAIVFDAETLSSDIGLALGDLQTDSGLTSAVIVSLFTDARALPGDRLPDEAVPPWDQVTPTQMFVDRRGFWGDAIPSSVRVDDGRQQVTGSRLWLLRRSKMTPDVLARAESYAREALAWLIDDGVARRIDVEAAADRTDWLVLSVVIWRPDGMRFDYAWRLPRGSN